MSASTAPFAYDVVLALDASPRVRASLPAIEEAYRDSRLLAATLNHRAFTLHEKNAIKGTIEAHHLDHLMFSIRPSADRLLSGRDRAWHGRVKALSQVVFVLQVMARYDIPRGIVDDGYLEVAGDLAGVRAGAIEDQILTFVEEVLTAFPDHANTRKQFPWLSSVTALLPAVRDRELTFLRSFPRHSGGIAYEYDDHQISPLEKDLFWVGFDPAFKDVPVEKPYPATKWTDLVRQSGAGRGLHEAKIRYCTRCCLPETMEGISFDEIGICVPCRSSEEKMHIDWDARGAKLARIIDGARSDTYYDCMLPMSGGKDSMYQAHVLKTVFDVDALAVTHGQNWLSRVGRYNLENCLQQFDLDHLVFNMNRAVINKVARKSLGAIGDACWHCHIGAGTFPVQSALAWQIDLMCFGESIAEADGRGSYQDQTEASLFYNLEVSAKVKADDMADECTPVRALAPWRYPDAEALAQRRIRLLHLGDFFFWDEERQVEFIKRNYEWMEASVENAYKGFKSVECVMAGVHDYANFIKRGIGRATIQASTDVRRGLLTREEGFELAKQFDTQRPHALDFYLQLTGLTEDEFERTLKDARAKSVYASKLPGE
jgi:N-acetyl sugar amidotransferase